MSMLINCILSQELMNNLIDFVFVQFRTRSKWTLTRWPIYYRQRPNILFSFNEKSVTM